MLEAQLDDRLVAGFVGSGAARHETFAPRYGWLKKGYDHACQDSGIFAREDAIETLGVGKNMVRSIRFWCLAFKLLGVQPGDRSGKVLKPTKLGQCLLGKGGWDPYLEDPASLWLLHTQLFTPPYQAASWPLVFSLYMSETFSASQLASFLKSSACDFPPLTRLSEKSLAKDASCILRMYGPHRRNEHTDIMCPFAELGLLRSSGDDRAFSFNLGLKRSLPSEVLLAASLAYVQASQPGGHTLSLSRLAHGLNSPGCVFRLSETDLGRSLEIAVRAVKGVYLVELHGSRQLQFDSDAGELYWDVLEAYYGRSVQ